MDKKQEILIGEKGQWKTLVDIVQWRGLSDDFVYDEAMTVEDKLEMIRKKLNQLLDISK